MGEDLNDKPMAMQSRSMDTDQKLMQHNSFEKDQIA